MAGEGADGGGHGGKRGRWAPTPCGHVPWRGWQGGADGCFCPPRKLLNQVGPSSRCRGEKQAPERNSLCPFKAIQRLGLEGSGWKGGIWHGLRGGGKPSRACRRETSRLLRSHPNQQLLGPPEPLSPRSQHPPQLRPSVRCSDPPCTREPRPGWSGASASAQPCRPSPAPCPPCPALPAGIREQFPFPLA